MSAAVFLRNCLVYCPIVRWAGAALGAQIPSPKQPFESLAIMFGKVVVVDMNTPPWGPIHIHHQHWLYHPSACRFVFFWAPLPQPSPVDDSFDTGSDIRLVFDLLIATWFSKSHLEAY